MNKIFATIIAILLVSTMAGSQTHVSGSFASNAEWTLAGSPFIITGNVTVNQAVTLTIDSGAVVQFRDNQSLYVYGNLSARHVLFTSDNDTIGGNPAKGDWNHIQIGDWGINGSATLDTCQVRYGGGNYFPSDNANIIVAGGTLNILCTEISNSKNYGVMFSSTNTGRTISMSDAYIFSCDWPIVYEAASTVAYSDENHFNGNTHNGVLVDFSSLNIGNNWVLNTIDIPYVFNQNFTVVAGSTLNVSSGNTLKFNDGSHLYIDGKLISNAGAGEKIIYTAYTDDNYGGDTNADGTATAPASRYWGGVVFTNTSVDSVCSMKRCTVSFAGDGNTGGITMYNAGPTIDSCELSNNFYGVMMQDLSNPVFSNNTIGSSEFVPIALSFNASPVFANNALSFSDNRYDAIGLLGSTTPGDGILPIRSVTSISNITYLLLQTITIPAGNTFTIKKGIVIKALEDDHFNYSRPRIVVQGKLIAEGTPDSAIVFTSARDDIYGHPDDTNRDGSQTSPNKGDWGGITFEGSSDTNSILDYCRVKYGSLPGDIYYNTRYISDGAITTVNASPIISHCVITDAPYGLYFFQASNPKISNDTIINTSYTPIALSVSANPALSGLSFTNTAWTALGIIGENLGYNGTIRQRNVGGYTNITYILLEDLTVNSGTYVTVDPGVVIKSNSAGIFVNGGFRAKGTIAVGNIIFTSIKDDNYGHPNDSNGDGNGTAAAPGDWKTIRFTGTSDDAFCLLDSCIIKFGGDDAWDPLYNVYTNWGGVTFTDANGTLTHTLITDSYNFGIRCEGSSVPAVDAVEFRNCRRDPIAMSLKSNPLLTNITFTSNGSKGIRILEGTLSSNARLGKRDVAGILNIAYIVDRLTISPNAILTIDPGVVIKFPENYDCNNNMIDVQGAMVANGTADQKIIFTSLKDDSNGGDTNNDGNSSSPERGDWWSIEFDNSPSDSLNVLRNCEIRYAGSNVCNPSADYKYYGEVRIFDAVVMIDSCIVQQSNSSGIGIYGSANPTIQNSQLYNIAESPISMSMFSAPTFSNNTALNVGKMALGIVPETYSVNATVPKRDFGGYTNITYYLIAYYWPNCCGFRHTINSGTTITIPAGVVFKGGRGIVINGALKIEGTAAEKVVFTDIRDDSYGNPPDMNGDGSSTEPAADQGQVSCLEFNDISDDSVSNLRYGVFRFQDNGIYLQQASPTISNCTFDGVKYGIGLGGVSTPIVDSCTFNNLMYAPLGTSLVSYPRSTVGNTISGTTYRGIGVWTETLTQDVTLRKRNFGGINNIPYLFYNYTVGTGAVLTIEPGVILKFFNNASLNVSKGLIAEGGSSPDSLIVFTDLKDDFYGGDSNGDSTASMPNIDSYGQDWRGIVFNDESLDPLCRLKHCVIRYAGYTGNSTYPGAGITANNASPTITYSSINNNYYGIMAKGSSNPVVNYSDIFQNEKYGIQNANLSFNIDARNNWWGNNSGPEYTGNPGGMGDGITDSVNYLPFRAVGAQQAMAGDVSLNGSVSAYDASFVLKYVVDPSGNPLNDAQLGVADVSGEMGITAFDASLILQYVVGNIQYFPVDVNHTSAPLVYPKVLASSIEVGNGKADRASSVVIPIRMNHLKNLASADIRLSFNDKILTPSEVKVSSDAGKMTIFSKFTKGQVDIAMASSNYIDIDGDVLYVTFIVSADVRGEVKSPIAISKLLLNEKDFTASATAGEVVVIGKPTEFALDQNYPNPFNPTTSIRYQLPEDGLQVSVTIYNSLGELVRTLVNHEQAAGYYELTWDGRSDAGTQVGSGLYFYRFTANGIRNFTAIKKMLLIK